MPKATKKNKKSRKPVVEEVFSVEKIVKKKVEEGKVFYLLKWFGFPDSENTWEPEENLSCPDLIENFEQSLAEATRSPSKVLDQIPMNCQVDSASNSHTTSSTETKKTAQKRRSKSQKANVEKKSKGAFSSSTSDTVQEKKAASSIADDAGDKNADENSDAKHVSGFAKDWEAQEILGATEEHGQILFLIKWCVRKKSSMILG